MTQGASQGPMVWTMAGETPASVPPPGVPSGMSAGSPVPPAGPPLHLPAGSPAAPPAAPPVVPPAAPPADLPEEYTPTARDLPIIEPGRTETLIDRPAVVPVPEPAPDPDAPDGMGPLYVVGDVHGYYDELREALAAEGLIDADGSWAAGNARLWFLGDFTDRGPDGIGVIDLVMQLSAEAAAAGGYCKALMGNHELLLLGAKRFGDTPVQSGAGTASFQAAWLLNGGQKTDMDRLEDHHLQWMARLDAVMEEDGHLLVHSDTTAYLDYGDSIEAVNDTVHDVLTRSEADEVWDLFRKFTKRFAFRDESGSQAVRELLDAYGGDRVVHGHSPIPYLLGEVGAEDGESESVAVDGPHVYADGLAIAMDGGITMAGKLLVVQLPLAG
ncbi:calcineurin-like phosphoesterase family protein [Streptomyces sp. 2333.5]|uniref:metallophosphoesterase n=1 Tax=Streptomyces TaxID=1883 RepID=UPI00089CE3E2|nr:calcineurin-like phosphoesterase family protein [Streptomyces sp. 2333.5]SED52102.1 Calcineurin-like phosphoesterase [Streptomyces sp. 2314.4]SEE36824.1 Calcineurin-like phosphoesterase [Streptomyces sp. 2112.2]SOE12404.1 Calcineurin-like phosphoesterase [Streptomyces sp. 2323.1]